MVTFAGYAPLYLAKEKGFFGDLDVRLQRIEDVPTIRAAVVKRELDAYLVIAELVAVNLGIGHTIKEAQRFNAADQLFVCFIVLGFIGLTTDLLMHRAHRWLFPYSLKSQVQQSA
jgi:hypothetical protein